MDTRDTPEQAELRRSARQLARELGPRTVADLDDATRGASASPTAVRDAGWLELRDDGGDGRRSRAGSRRRSSPTRSARPSPTSRSRARSSPRTSPAGPARAASTARVVAFSPDLLDAAVRRRVRSTTAPSTPSTAPTSGPIAAYVLVPEGDGYRLARRAGRRRERRERRRRPHARDAPRSRPARRARRSPTRPGSSRATTSPRGPRSAWRSRAPISSGVMRGVLDVTVAYATERRQYGVPVGSFQAVQHLLAEARCLMEGSLSVALHASWAVDNLAPADALRRRPRRQGLLRTRRAHGVRDRGAGARRHRQHVGVHRARLPAPRVALVAVVRRRRRAAPRSCSATRLGVADGLS